MTASDRLAARAKPRDRALAEAAAQEQGVTVSEYIRQTVRQRAMRDLRLRPAEENGSDRREPAASA